MTYIHDWTEDLITKQYLDNRDNFEEEIDDTDDIVDEILFERKKK